jgi:hypothetical protein
MSFAATVAERDSKSADKKAKILEKAAKDLERFYVEVKSADLVQPDQGEGDKEEQG